MEARARAGYSNLETRARARARQGASADRELEVLDPIIKADPKFVRSQKDSLLLSSYSE